jgi:hypothetical protein
MRRLLTIAVLVMAAPAYAEDEPAPSNYRIPLGAADVVSVAMVVVPLTFDGDIDSDAGLWTARAGVAFLAFGGSAVHAAYGETDRALGSFLLRGGGATLGAIVGRVIPCDGAGCSTDQTAIGAVAGAGAAMLAEVIWYADKPVQNDHTAFVPYLAGTELGVAGRF